MVIYLFFFRFSVLDGKAFTQHPFPLSALTSLPCIFQQFKKNICRAVFLLLHQHFPFLEEKYLINFSFVQRDLVFCFFSPWRWKIMRPLIFWFPQCMAHQNSSFYYFTLLYFTFTIHPQWKSALTCKQTIKIMYIVHVMHVINRKHCFLPVCW